MSLKGRDFLTLKDFTRQEIEEMVNLGIDLKAKQKAGIPTPILEGKTLGMIFQKSSTRTRVSFEVGMYQLGGSALFLSTNDLQIGRGEPIKDTARVLSRYLDGIMIRTYSHADVEELAEYADIPVINGLTDDYHPTQIIADLITIQEHKGKLEGIKFAYVGDGNNMTHSLMIGCAKVGMDVTVACPDGYMPNPEIVALAQGYAAESGGSVTVMHDPKEAVKGVDVVYTDTWASMGQEAEKEIRKKAFVGYQVDDAMMALAKPDAIFMHCLPAYRGMEVTDEVMESAQSVVFDEA
ncbi:MAG: ornithine carbamoyltransferase, partial [Peptococcaceae bacterium]|nr:ornithine carbamoyltransferase [Peptococcaceae bacterium]